MMAVLRRCDLATMRCFRGSCGMGDLNCRTLTVLVAISVSIVEAQRANHGVGASVGEQ